jgi:hypothetical protein
MKKIHYFCIAATILVACCIGHAQGTETDVKRSWNKKKNLSPI